jgi:hypothetical protein
MPGLVWNKANPGGKVGSLGPNQSATLTATYIVTAADALAGNVHNSATAHGDLSVCLDSCDVVSPPAEVTVPVTTEPTEPTPPVNPVTPAAPAAPAPPVATSLPVTGSGPVAGNDPDMAILLLTTGALVLFAIAFDVRRRAMS